MDDIEVDVLLESGPTPILNATTAASRRASSLVGRVLSDRYRIDALLAFGGMGSVYRGEHLLLKKRIAVKMLHADIDRDPALHARFEREAMVGAHVRHPNVVAVTDFGTLDDGSQFLVLDYLRGKTLHEILYGGPLPARRAAAIARQIASGLAAVHAKDIVHRDLKPLNVMLVPGSRGDPDLAKIIDFGFATVSSGRLSFTSGEYQGVAQITRTGEIFGTIAYLPPEAANGMGALDARSDLYALGLILYMMLTGKHPFDADDPARMFAKHVHDKPPRFAVRAPKVHVPRELEELTLRLLEKDPARRFPSADAVVAAIDGAIEAIDATDPQPSSIYVPMQSMRPYLLGLVFAGLAAGGIVASCSASVTGPELHVSP